MNDPKMDIDVSGDLSGTALGRIKLGEKLGQGGMGEVFEGFDEVLERKVAVKVLKGADRALSSQKARFLREAKTLSRLDHPNICKILDYVTLGDRDFLILEFVDGTRLDKVIQTGLGDLEKHRLAREITDALVVAHSHNVIHRDLKPENVMVTPNGDVKVLDFGLARWVEGPEPERPLMRGDGQESFGDSGPALTMEGTVLGTPRYLSPEQAMGQPLTTQSDMYVLGLLLQEIFTCQAAISRGLSFEDTLKQAVLGQSQPVMGVDRDYSCLIEELKALAPSERPTARAVADRLEWIVLRPKRRRRKWILAGLGMVLVLATAISSIGFLSARRSELSARAAQDKAEAVSGFLQDMLASADPWELGLDVKVVDVLDHASTNAERDFGDQKLHQAAVLHALGDTFQGLGRLEKARDHLERARTIRTEILGQDHLDTLETSLRLAVVFQEQGHPEQADQLVRRVLGDLEKTVGENHIRTLESKKYLVLALDGQGRYEEAESLCEEVLTQANEVLGGDHPEVWRIKNTLARVLDHQGKYETAEALYRQILSKREDLLGHDHPDTLATKNNLASVVGAQERLEEAIAIQRGIQDQCRETFGEDHPHTLSSLNNLAGALNAFGLVEEAETIHRQALKAMQETLGEDHPHTISSMSNLGFTLSAQGRVDEAVALLNDVLELRRRRFADDHPDTIQAMNNLATILAEQGQYETAEVLFQDVIKARLRVLGDGHPATTTAMNNLGFALVLQEKFDAAEKVFREELVLLLKNHGPDHRETLYANYCLGHVLEALGRKDEAIVQYRIAAEGQLIDAQKALSALGEN